MWLIRRVSHHITEYRAWFMNPTYNFAHAKVKNSIQMLLKLKNLALYKSEVSVTWKYQPFFQNCSTKLLDANFWIWTWQLHLTSVQAIKFKFKNWHLGVSYNVSTTVIHPRKNGWFFQVFTTQDFYNARYWFGLTIQYIRVRVGSNTFL